MSKMNIAFHRPPEALRVGGLELAIDEMAAALRALGASVFFADEAGGGRPDVAWFHGLWQPDYRRAAADYQRRGIPYVVSPHGMLEPWAMRHKAWKKVPYFYLREKGWLDRAAVLFSTGALESASIGQWLPGGAVEEVPLGLAAQQEPDYERARGALGWAPEEKVLLYLSRVHPKKGLWELVNALAENETPNVRLVVVGDGDAAYVKRIHAFICANASRLPRIDVVGPVWGAEKWPYLQGADLFCLPTYSENFGLAVLEALRVGTPVFTTDQTPWGGFQDRAGVHIVSPGQASVTAGMGAVLTDYVWAKEDRNKLADWAKSAFDWQTIGSRYLSVLESVGG